MGRRFLTRLIVGLLVTALLVGGCTGGPAEVPSTGKSPTSENPTVPSTPPALEAAPPSDAGLLLPPGPLRESVDHVSPENVESVSATVATELLNAFRTGTDDQRLIALEQLFLEAGVSIFDGSEKPELVLQGRATERPTYLQAAQVRLLAEEATPTSLSVNNLVAATQAMLSELDDSDPSGRMAEEAVREYFLAVIEQPINSADKILAALILRDSADPSSDLASAHGGHLTQAIAYGGDYQLTMVQAALLMTRARADGLLLTALGRQEAGIPPATPSLRGGAGALSVTTGGCSIDPIPDAAYSLISSATSLLIARKILELENLNRFIEAFNIKIIAADPGPWPIAATKGLRVLAMGAALASVSVTLLNFFVMAAMFDASVSGAPQPLVRTKSTADDGETIGMRATFELGRAKWLTSAVRWWNCLARLASSVGLDGVFTEPGRIKTAPVTWRVADQPGDSTAAVQLSPEETQTDGEGTAYADLTGQRQPIELDAGASPHHRNVRVIASVHPGSLAQLFVTAGLELVAGVLAGPAGLKLVIADVAIKAALFAVDRLGFWQGEAIIDMIDWQYDYTLSAAIVATDKTEIAYGSTDRHYALSAYIPVELGAQAILHYEEASGATTGDSSSFWGCGVPENTPGINCHTSSQLASTTDGTLTISSVTSGELSSIDPKSLVVRLTLSGDGETYIWSCTGTCGPDMVGPQERRDVDWGLSYFYGGDTYGKEPLEIILKNWQFVYDSEGEFVEAKIHEEGGHYPEVNTTVEWTIRSESR